MKSIKPLALGLLTALFVSGFLHAQTIHYVKPGGSGSGASWANASGDIQAMLNASAAGDQVWVAAGTYIPNRRADAVTVITPNDRNNAFVLTPNVKVYGGFAGDENVITARHGGVSTLSGNVSGGAYHVVVSAGEVGTAVLDGFTVAGGYSAGLLDASKLDGSITVNGAPIYYLDGGGINIYKSSPTISNCIIRDNSTVAAGGGIFNDNSSPTITNCTINNNTSGAGGGIFNDNSSPTIINCTVGNNSASFFIGIGVPYASEGGGILNVNSSPTITNCAIIDNKAVSGGESIYNENSSTSITNCTISNNSLYNYNSNGYTLTITNSIIFGNSTLSGNTGNSAAIVNFSIVQGATVYPGTGNSNADPLFKDPTTGDYSLQESSPAIDKGDNAAYTDATDNDPATDKDLAGNPRLIGKSIDIGAYEYPQPAVTIFPDVTGIVYVNKNAPATSNGKGDSWTNAAKELADALVFAKTNTNIKQIWVAEGAYYPLYSANDKYFGSAADPDLRNNAFVLTPGVKIYGGFAGDETTVGERHGGTSTLSGDIDRDGTFTGNAYHVVISAGEVSSAMLDGFTISGGNADYEIEINVNNFLIRQIRGGGIFNTSSSPAITNCIIKNNIAAYLFGEDFDGSGGGSGGGIYNESSLPVITNSAITNNKADYGGGICNTAGSKPTLINCSINANSATFGGGIFNSESLPAFINCNITLNTSNNEGGGIYNIDASAPVLTNCTVSNNTAEGIYNLSGTFTMTNSIIFGNKTGIVNADAPPVVTYSIVQSATVYPGIGNSNADPLFKDPATGDYSLQESSPAIDKGDNAAYTAATGKDPATDKDLSGKARLYNDIIDMGAYEYRGIDLPVTGLYLTAQVQGNNNVLLKWGATTEINSKNFTVQRSASNSTWVNINTQPTQALNGNSATPLSYAYTDTGVSSGIYLYRIIETDIAGNTQSSNMARVEITGNQIKIYPNPASSVLTVAGVPVGTLYKLVNTSGATVRKGTTGNNGKIPVSGIVPGTYLLQITVNNIVQTYKVQIQR
ncbi:MAG: right-handed parallel beta-helix repeat-containing protein [Chitinophagaceae bacterium]|nr:right-handed parallel beta-helix repeat-containing protein [Chitinophagaceae bacterium]